MTDQDKGMPNLLPSFTFDASDLPPADRFDGWAHLLAPLFDLALADGGDGEGFQGAMTAFLMGDIMVAQTRFSPLEYRRDRKLASRSEVDGYLIQWFRQGGFDGMTGVRETSIRPGDIVLNDLSGTSATSTRTSATVSLIIPRHKLEKHLAHPSDLNGLVLHRDSAFADLCRSHLRGLIRAGRSLTDDQARQVSEGTIALIARLLAGATPTTEAPKQALALALADRARDVINANLASPGLTPAFLCQILKVSRTHLHRAFADVGGVANVIRERRLRRAWRELQDPANRKVPVATIGYRCGFANDGHFSRCFRQYFGVGPSESRDARGHDRSGGDPGRGSPLAQWLAPRPPG